jgi:hypothetical protein
LKQDQFSEHGVLFYLACLFNWTFGRPLERFDDGVNVC